jgi:hypothetical protein
MQFRDEHIANRDIILLIPAWRFTKMRRILFAATPAILFSFAPALAQLPAEPVKQPVNAPAPGPCPTVQIQAPAGRIFRDGQPVTFAANIAGGDPNVAPTIVWNTSAGTIVGGQGTKSIHVDSTGAGSNREITADLWLGGYAPECVVQASASVKVAGPASKIDEFGELPVEKENERLAEFVSSLPAANDHIFLFAYAGRNSPRGYTSSALRRIKTQLVANGVPTERISITDGGFRETPSFEFWLVPEGADAPKPSPTVDRKEIVYPAAPKRTAAPVVKKP